MEYIQRKCCNHGITQGVLLEKMSSGSSRLFVPPGTPLIHHQRHLLLWIVFIHDGDMFTHHLFYLEAFAHGPVKIVGIETCGRTFASVPSGYRIIMKRQTIHTASHLFHQCFRPVIIVIAGSAGNLEQLVSVVIAAIGCITAVQIGVIFRTHAAATSPAFVPYSPELHFPCLVSTVLPAQVGHGAVAFRSDIFHPLGHLLNASATYIGTHIGFASQ